jgi:hypothetical protein
MTKKEREALVFGSALRYFKSLGKGGGGGGTFIGIF